MPKKKKKIRITVSDKHRKAMQWCLNNNITVGILPTTKGLKIEINDNGKNKKSPKIYDQEVFFNFWLQCKLVNLSNLVQG